MKHMWKAKNALLKSPEWYVVFSYEYVLRVVKTEKQVHLLKLLLDHREHFFGDEEVYEYLENEDLENDIAGDWESYTSRVYAILTRAVTNRTPRPNDLQWLKTSFAEQYSNDPFLNTCLKEDNPFSRHLHLIESIKKATFYYIYGDEER
ncbi:hypothetical protein ACFQPF_05315 [Fictibacillus iocasae]|uniref:Uncharacterized protein n=1 Tax=Fictibacillus iocasae TaxID=2715437 RepID=A0ABW2NPK9_9BACL